MEIENNLACLREQKGFSQREVAEELGITRQAVSHWEAGKAFPSMEKQLALSRLYGVSVEELYHRGDTENDREKDEPPETSDNVPAETLPPAAKTKWRAQNTHRVVLIVCLCWVVGDLLWGKLTNSLHVAINYLIEGMFILGFGWLMYLSYLIYKYIRRKNESEKD